jgi:glycosyltransferase involved in cell wall biosynthesis
MNNKKLRNKERNEKKARTLRILWSSNAVFTSSGYGNGSRLVLYKMIEAGYPVAMQAFYGLMGGKIVLDGLPIYPRLQAAWGEDGLILHAKDWNADVVMTFQDIFPMDMNALKQVKNWIPWVPVDGEPLSEHTKARLNLAAEIMTHSKFGHSLLVKSGYSSTYIPLSVDTKVLKPVDRKEARKRFGMPEDIFMFGMVAANKDNPSRKSFQEVIDAFAEVHKKNPKTGLFFHTNLMDLGAGFPIMEYCAYKGLQGSVFNLDPYTMQFRLDREAMAYLFSSFDCLLNPSTREGFGMSIIEAQSCGVPVIVNDCQSMPELVGQGKICKTGWKQWSLTSYLPHPDATDLEEKMLEMIDEVGKNGPEMSQKARSFVVENYDNDLVYDKYWSPYLERLQKRYGSK